MPWLIKAFQLDSFRKNQKNVIILDASWHLPSENRDAREEFMNKHVSGAKFLDLDAFHDQTNPIPNMLVRDEAYISEKLGQLGITNEHKIILYDNSKLHSSCRALWMFKVFGHNPYHLYIVDGGLPSWEKYGGKMESGAPKTTNMKNYQVDYQSHLVRTLMQMKTNLHHPMEQVVDMRNAIRYMGGPELRQGLRSGHIPNSFSFPYTTMFESDGTFKSMDKIKRQLQGIALNLDSPIVTLCGSGITAAILNFVLDILNTNKHSLYDGSWSEWGSDQLYPGELNLDERPIDTSI